MSPAAKHPAAMPVILLCLADCASLAQAWAPHREDVASQWSSTLRIAQRLSQEVWLVSLASRSKVLQSQTLKDKCLYEAFSSEHRFQQVALPSNRYAPQRSWVTVLVCVGVSWGHILLRIAMLYITPGEATPPVQQRCARLQEMTVAYNG